MTTDTDPALPAAVDSIEFLLAATRDVLAPQLREHLQGIGHYLRAERKRALSPSTRITAPCYAVFPDDSPVLVASIHDGRAYVINESGDSWDVPVTDLRPAHEGWKHDRHRSPSLR